MKRSIKSVVSVLLILDCPDVLLKDIRAVFFDKDGTLVSVETYLQYLTEAFLQQLGMDAKVTALLRSRYGISADGVDRNGLMAVGSRQACTEAAMQILVAQGMEWGQAQEKVQTAFDLAERSLPRKAPLTPLVSGILDLLVQLQRQQIATGILTSDSLANLQDFITYYGLESQIQLAWGSEPGALSKPDPIFYREACHQLGLSPQQTLMIGDAEADYRMAAEAGASAITVSWGWQRARSW